MLNSWEYDLRLTFGRIIAEWQAKIVRTAFDPARYPAELCSI
jgi:hypothetical protein